MYLLDLVYLKLLFLKLKKLAPPHGAMVDVTAKRVVRFFLGTKLKEKADSKKLVTFLFKIGDIKEGVQKRFNTLKAILKNMIKFKVERK